MNNVTKEFNKCISENPILRKTFSKILKITKHKEIAFWLWGKALLFNGNTDNFYKIQ